MTIKPLTLIPIPDKLWGRAAENLSLRYCSIPTVWGSAVVASSEGGLCFLGFEERPSEGADELQRRFPGARLISSREGIHDAAIDFFMGKEITPQLPLFVRGTKFQLQVWDALLEIPKGELSRYGEIARHIGHPKASRAVGSAVGRNPISLLIPCHRVVQSTGQLGGYFWGSERKRAILDWEAQASKDR